MLMIANKVINHQIISVSNANNNNNRNNINDNSDNVNLNNNGESNVNPGQAAANQVDNIIDNINRLTMEKRDFIIEKQIARHFVEYSKCLSNHLLLCNSNN